VHAASLHEQAETHRELPLWNASAYRSDIDAGTTLGLQVAQAVIDYCATDGHDAEWTGAIPTGEGLWYSSQTPPKPPVTPHWAEVRPWLMDSPDQFRAPAPPTFGSAEFNAAVEQLVQITTNRTLEQARIASTWSDGPWTYTPPGHWNDIAGELIFLHRLNPLRAARVLALLNAAEMDASIAAWDSKYAYWLIRPSQVDARIDHGDWQLPNFPAYTSGHSCFSGAGSAVLAWFFPTHAATLRRFGEEAGMSRVYGGIHYMFDNTEGLAQGRAIAGLAIDFAQQDGASIRQVTSTRQLRWEPEEAMQ
jgi:membrane-associated phospholipid phosphatase